MTEIDPERIRALDAEQEGVALCSFCDWQQCYVPGSPGQEIATLAMMAHVRQCQAHPLLKRAEAADARITALEAENKRLQKLLDEGAFSQQTLMYYGHQALPNATVKLLVRRAETAEAAEKAQSKRVTDLEAALRDAVVRFTDITEMVAGDCSGDYVINYAKVSANRIAALLHPETAAAPEGQ